MTDQQTKQELLNEISKVSNVYGACSKVGISRATYYRLKKSDSKFCKLANQAEKIGRRNMCDIAEFSLLKNVKGGNQRAIEYALNHNSKRYRNKQMNNVITFIHKKDLPQQKTGYKTIEELLADQDKELDQDIKEIEDKSK